MFVVADVCFLFKQKTAYEMRISDWSSDVRSSDLLGAAVRTPYPGTQTKGHLNFSREEIETLLREIIGRDDQPVLHVVGDATAETVLDAMAAIAPAEDWRPPRLRFEHGDGLRADLLGREIGREHV